MTSITPQLTFDVDHWLTQTYWNYTVSASSREGNGKFTASSAHAHLGPMTAINADYGSSHATYANPLNIVATFFGWLGGHDLDYGHHTWRGTEKSNQTDAHQTIRMLTGAANAEDHFLITGQGWDDVYGGYGNELIVTEGGHDRVTASWGNDRIYTGANDDVVYGGEGNDWIAGDLDLRIERKGSNALSDAQVGTIGTMSFVDSKDDARTNQLYEEERGKGNDRLHGGNGHDVIFGGLGADVIYGDAGNDFIDPGARGHKDNHDQVWGGSGADIFNLSGTDNSTDANPWVDSVIGSFAGLPSNYADQAVAVAASSIISSETAKTALKIGGSVAGFLGGVGGAVAAGAVSTLIDQLSKTDQSKDQVEIMDFNPTEDVLIVPLSDRQQFTAIPVNLVHQGVNQWAIELRYEDADDGKVSVFTRIYLDQGFQREVGIWNTVDDTTQFNGAVTVGPQAARAQGVVTDILNAGIVTGTANGANAFGDDLISQGGTQTAIVYGAPAAMMRYGNHSDTSPVIGSRFGDALSANDRFVEATDQLSSGDMNATAIEMHGFAGNDRIWGSTAADELFGGAGNDRIMSMGTGGEVEEIYGGAGNDTVIAGMVEKSTGGLNKYNADGGAGRDHFSFEHYGFGVSLAWGEWVDVDSGDKVTGMIGRDSFELITNGETYARPEDQFRLTGFEQITGTDQDDHFDFAKAQTALTIDGGAGDDVMIGSQTHRNTFRSGEGADQIQGGKARDLVDFRDAGAGVTADLSLEEAVDGQIFLAGIEDLIGSDHGDTLTGNALANDIRGGQGNDIIDGGAGNDRLSAREGENTFYGGEGNDEIDGGRHEDTLFGGNGDDELEGGGANDALYGGNGDDRLRDREGANLFDGGRGDDDMRGARRHVDTFVFREGDGDDRISGFEAGIDRLDFQLDAGATLEIVHSGYHYWGGTSFAVIDYGSGTVEVSGYGVAQASLDELMLLA